jgi:outer membrane protein OmpA-like peptidoglycan-associated protein
MRTLIIAGAVLAAAMPAAYAQTAPKPAAPAPTPAPATTQQQMAKFLVFFDWDKWNLTPQAKQVVAQAAEEFKRTGRANITATGHTDTSGSAKYNQWLSERRAESVKQELVRLGVPAANIVTIGRGQNDLLVPTKDNVREAQNRRVEITFAKTVAPPPAPVAVAPPPPPPPPKWSVSLGPWAGYNLKETDSGSGKTAWLLGPNLAVEYLATPNVPIRVNGMVFNTIGTSENDGWGIGADVGAGYQFNIGNFKPYIGPHIGYIAGKGVQDSPYVGPEAGAKFDFGPNWYMYGKVAYDVLFLRNSIGDGIINGGLGAGYRF